MILSTMKNNLIEAGLWIDDMIYSLISLVYSLINKLAQYQVFDSKDITSFSKRVYILLGIFMLFKLTFSMITYLVNPDQFSDKSKGFGGMIKNVMISMILMVTVPYIFSEAYYVQKMILEDGTLIKVIFPKGGEAGSNTSYGYVNDTAGEDIKFILFSQFIKPNTNIVACKTLYEYDENGDRLVNEDGVLTIDEECKTALKDAFKKEDTFNFYVDGMTYQSYDLLTSESEIYTETFKTTDKRGKTVTKEVITYHWLISTIVGIVTLLALTTICLDVALRSIKLGLYQIIAPIPIISNCDPKAGKDGMLQKWIKACVSTYVDLFIRLFILYLGLYLIITLVNNMKFDGIASVILIIGVLMFVKQCPKIIQDLTGLKVDGFTLNPFKKIKNEIPESLSKGLHQARLRATGAAGGFLAGMVGGGRNFGQRLLSAGMGTARGAVKGKGFAAGLNAQADVNRKIRDARINGASFLGGVGAAVASTFGLDNADLEKKATLVNKRKGASRQETEEHDAYKKRNDAHINRIKNSFANTERRAKREKEVYQKNKALKDFFGSELEAGKAGASSRKLSVIESKANQLKALHDEKKVLNQDYVYYAAELQADGVSKKIVKKTLAAGQVVDDKILAEASETIGLFKNKDGVKEFGDVMLHKRMGYKPIVVEDAETGALEYKKNKDGEIVWVEMTQNEKDEFAKSQGKFLSTEKAAREANRLFNEEFKDYQKMTSYIDENGNEVSVEEDDINVYRANFDNMSYGQLKDMIDLQEKTITDMDTTMQGYHNNIERIDDDTKLHAQRTTVTFDGKTYTLDEFNNETDRMDKEVKREQERRKPNYDSANANNPFR